MLHGLWSPGSGLVLWHQPGGDAVAADELPDPLGGIVRAARFRHRAEVLVPGPQGAEPVEVRGHALAPEMAARVLLQELPGGVVAGDLRFLAHVARGVERWVSAGRIVPEVRREDGEWWVRWRLLGGQRQRAWLAELAVAMPAALRVAGRPSAVLEHFTGEITDPIARLRLAAAAREMRAQRGDHVPPAARPSEAVLSANSSRLNEDLLSTNPARPREDVLSATPARLNSLPDENPSAADALGDKTARVQDEPGGVPTHPLIAALVGDEPLESGSHRVAAVLDDWRTSLTADEPDLVLRLLEPQGEEADSEHALWRLEVCLRVEGEAPQPVTLPGDPQLVRVAGEKLAAAKAAYPRLRDLPGDGHSMDLLLPTGVVLDLVAHGAQALQAAGVRLLLPRAWRVTAPSLRLRVQSPAATESAVGMEGLVSYHWELALGDTVLTPAEMGRLIQAKTDLVQLRGQWVQADHRALAAAAEYVSGRADDTPTTIAGLFAELAANPVKRVPLESITATGWAAQLLDAEHPTEPTPPPLGLKAELRPYQQRGLTWLATMSRLGCGAVLADDMGLGKTIQVLALLLHERETAPNQPQSRISGVAEWATGAGDADQVTGSVAVEGTSRTGLPEAKSGEPERSKRDDSGAGDSASADDRATGSGIPDGVPDAVANADAGDEAAGSDIRTKRIARVGADGAAPLLLFPASVVGNWGRDTDSGEAAAGRTATVLPFRGRGGPGSGSAAGARAATDSAVSPNAASAASAEGESGSVASPNAASAASAEGESGSAVSPNAASAASAEGESGAAASADAVSGSAVSALDAAGESVVAGHDSRAEGAARVLPTLLVCPMSVVGNWQREAERFAPGLRVLVHHGAGRRSGPELDGAVRDSDLVVTTYALLARDVEELKRQDWQRVVVDEAQHIKNAATRQARAARAIPARHRLALTGTPVENRLEELRSILDFANPKLLGKPSEFHARFAIPIERERDENAVARLRAITAPFVLRRVKTDPRVISDLPEKIEMTVRANLTVEQAALYQAVLDDMTRKLKEAKASKEDMGRKGAVLAALTRLKQVCNHPAHYLGDGSAVLRRGRHRSGKLALVEDILESVLADGERALLFTQFREFGDLVAPFLTERFGVEIPFLHGGVSKQRRDTMVTDFQSDDGPPLMLLSLKAGGTGLNLTAANHVVHLDRWWNPAVENQATDRAFRIGQRRDVQVRKLVCVDTIEERIDDMLSGKRQLADLTVGVGENWITELSDDELRDLFALGSEAVGE
ncbi:SNF2-related protein [Nocardia sp. NPDC050406]|uniref:SNF2-related protein n=1 Tax=Nocardia sp. NPDC050406 TaxID=3364318 RepID=UPI0037B8BFA9